MRIATSSDIPGMMIVRYAVRENILSPGVIDEKDCRREIHDTGRGWVVEQAGEIKAFAIGNAQTGNIWALFVSPDAQGKGYGSRLHDVMIDWLWAQGLSKLWLTTGAQTKAKTFYEKRGWQNMGLTTKGEVRFELLRDQVT
jgi:GNAT superfamily N-acetyltransferase